MVDQVGGGLGHAPGVAGGTDTAPLAGESHQEVVTTLGAARPSKSMGQNAAFEVTSKLPLDVGRNRIIVPAFGRKTQIGLEMFLDHPIQDRLGRISRTVYGWGSDLAES